MEQGEGPLLQLISRDRLSSQQKAFLQKKSSKRLPVYKLLREPTHFDEFDWKKRRRIAICRENGTVICVSHGFFEPCSERCVAFELDTVGEYCLYCAIYGETNTAIAETITFFWSLKHSVNARTTLRVSVKRYRFESIFDFAALQPDQLACILDSNPARYFAVPTGILSAEQSVVLATRPYPLQLELQGDGFAFNDEGTAFVDALEKRQSSFGLLYIIRHQPGTPFGSDNLQRLVEFDIFETLGIYFPDKQRALVPFLAKAAAVDYRVDARHFQPEDFESLHIATNDLTVNFFLDGEFDQIDDDDYGGDYYFNDTEWDRILISLFDRVAQLGHLERLCFSVHNRLDQFDFFEDPYEFETPFDVDKVAPIAAALVRAIEGNPKLSHLDLSKSICKYLDWGPHLPTIAEAMEGHESLRGFIVQAKYEFADDHSESSTQPDYSWLERLLSRNRNITVLDGSADMISDGAKIDDLYALNYFFKGSAALVKVSTSLRSSLVAKALTKSARKNLQYMALLLSNHTDSLCEFIQGTNLEDSHIVSSVSVPQRSHGARSPKRNKTTRR